MAQRKLVFRVVVKRFEERMAELVRQQNRLNDARAAGLVFAKVRVKGYDVPAYHVEPHHAFRLVRLDGAKRRAGRR